MCDDVDRVTQTDVSRRQTDRPGGAMSTVRVHSTKVACVKSVLRLTSHQITLHQPTSSNTATQQAICYFLTRPTLSVFYSIKVGCSLLVVTQKGLLLR